MSQADLCRRLDDLTAKFRQGASYYAELADLDPQSRFVAEWHKCHEFLELAAQQVEQGICSLRSATTDAAERAAMASLRSLVARWKRHRGHVDNHHERIAQAGSNLECVLDGGTAWQIADESFLAQLRLRRGPRRGDS